ncbi:MAG: ECF transporter S component [Methanoregula sp.]|nr:ECF transporter S component [Methanoregula sp.]
MENTVRKNGLFTREKFSTSDIIVISLFGAIGIIVGFIGNIFHGLSGLSVIGPFILHTLIPGIVVFSCAVTVKKPGAATLYSLIASIISMTLMGVPIFIIMYVVQGLLIDGLTLLMGKRMWTWWGICISGLVYGIIGIFILYYVVLASQGLQFPFWVFLISIPTNVGFALVAALIGLRIGTRASQALIK